MANSIRKRVSRHPKPAKPTKDFPLFAHLNGQWAKKVRGKLLYFGLWSDPGVASDEWVRQKDDLLAGRTPRPKTGQLTVKDLADRFLTSKKLKIDSGELSPRTFADYLDILQHVANILGKNRPVTDLAPDDFQTLRASFAVNHGPHRLAKDVVVTRSLFKWGYESGLIDKPVRFGPDFKSPSRKAKLKATRANGRKDFDSTELRRIIDAASMPLKAMILLGINAGLGQNDIANLHRSHVDLESGWLIFPRPKTEVERRCPLWKETVIAIQEVLANRPDPQDDADSDCVFLTHRGTRVLRLIGDSRTDTVGPNFSKLVKDLGIKGRRGFYSLRHSFATTGGECCDQIAVNLIMGHSDPSMAANYRHRISDKRLKDVVNVVREWLWLPENDTNNDSDDVHIIQFTTAG